MEKKKPNELPNHLDKGEWNFKMVTMEKSYHDPIVEMPKKKTGAKELNNQNNILD